MNEHIRRSAAAMREAGSTPEAVVTFLHGSGCMPMESIKMVREIFSMSFGEAKDLVSSHPCFRNATDEADKLHDEILKELRKRD